MPKQKTQNYSKGELSSAHGPVGKSAPKVLPEANPENSTFPGAFLGELPCGDGAISADFGDIFGPIMTTTMRQKARLSVSTEHRKLFQLR